MNWTEVLCALLFHAHARAALKSTSTIPKARVPLVEYKAPRSSFKDLYVGHIYRRTTRRGNTHDYYRSGTEAVGLIPQLLPANYVAILTVGSGIRRSTGCALLRTFFAYPSIVGQSTVDIFLTLPVVIIDARFLPAPNRTTNTNRKATHKPTTKTPESEKDIYYIYKNTSNPFWKSSVSLNRSRTSKHAQPHTRTFESKVYLVSQRAIKIIQGNIHTRTHTQRKVRFRFRFR